MSVIGKTNAGEELLAICQAFESWVEFEYRGYSSPEQYVEKLGEATLLCKVIDRLTPKKSNPSIFTPGTKEGNARIYEGLLSLGMKEYHVLSRQFFEHDVLAAHRLLVALYQKALEQFPDQFPPLKDLPVAIANTADGTPSLISAPSTPLRTRSQTRRAVTEYNERRTRSHIEGGSGDHSLAARLAMHGNSETGDVSGPSTPISSSETFTAAIRDILTPSGVKKKLKESNTLIRNLSDERNKLRDQVQNLKSQKQALSEEKKKLQSKVADNTKEIAEITDARKQLQKEIESLSASLAKVQQLLTEKDKELDEISAEFRKECASLRAKISTLNDQVSTYENKMTNENDAQVAALIRHRQEAEERVHELEENLKMMEESHLQAQELREREIKQLEQSYNRLKTSTASVHDRANKTFSKCRQAHGVLQQTRTAMHEMRDGIQSNFSRAVQDFSTFSTKLTSTISIINQKSMEANTRFLRESKERRRVFNVLQELRGNIRVFCRVRPVLPSEIEANDTAVVNPSSDYEVNVTADRGNCIDTNNGNSHSNSVADKMFEFDRVFNASSTQQEVYDEISPMVMSAMDGFHACIFAYGQTGSGKTFTMEGNTAKEGRGMYYRTLHQLFEEQVARSDSHEYKLNVSMVEIYNEVVRDLLASNNSTSSASNGLDIKRGPYGNYLPDAESITVHEVSDVQNVMARGAANRAVGATNANEHSSRSHSLLMVDIHGRNKVNGLKTYGRLVLVDLAGSERLSKSKATGKRMTEAQNINKSLSALGDVIAALTHKQSHIPYRNSKLTYLLQDSLGKDNKTLMIVQVSPVASSRGETQCSLNFASRVRKVEQGQAKKHADNTEANKLKAIVAKYKEEARLLAEERNSAKEALSNAQAQAKTMKKELKGVSSKLEAAEASEAASETATSKRIEKFKSRIMEEKQAREKLEQKVSTLEKKLKEAQSAVTKQKNEDASEKLEAVRAATKKANHSAATKHQQELEKSLEETKKKMSAQYEAELKSIKHNHTSELESMQEQHEATLKSIQQQHEAQIAELQVQIRSLSTVLQNNQIDTSELLDVSILSTSNSSVKSSTSRSNARTRNATSSTSNGGDSVSGVRIRRPLRSTSAASNTSNTRARIVQSTTSTSSDLKQKRTASKDKLNSTGQSTRPMKSTTKTMTHSTRSMVNNKSQEVEQSTPIAASSTVMRKKNVETNKHTKKMIPTTSSTQVAPTTRTTKTTRDTLMKRTAANTSNVNKPTAANTTSQNKPTAANTTSRNKPTAANTTSQSKRAASRSATPTRSVTTSKTIVKRQRPNMTTPVTKKSNTTTKAQEEERKIQSNETKQVGNKHVNKGHTTVSVQDEPQDSRVEQDHTTMNMSLDDSSILPNKFSALNDTFEIHHAYEQSEEQFGTENESEQDIDSSASTISAKSDENAVNETNMAQEKNETILQGEEFDCSDEVILDTQQQTRAQQKIHFASPMETTVEESNDHRSMETTKSMQNSTTSMTCTPYKLSNQVETHELSPIAMCDTMKLEEDISSDNENDTLLNQSQLSSTNEHEEIDAADDDDTTTIEQTYDETMNEENLNESVDLSDIHLSSKLAHTMATPRLVQKQRPSLLSSHESKTNLSTMNENNHSLQTDVSNLETSLSHDISTSNSRNLKTTLENVVIQSNAYEKTNGNVMIQSKSPEKTIEQPIIQTPTEKSVNTCANNNPSISVKETQKSSSVSFLTPGHARKQGIQVTPAPQPVPCYSKRHAMGMSPCVQGILKADEENTHETDENQAPDVVSYHTYETTIPCTKQAHGSLSNMHSMPQEDELNSQEEEMESSTLHEKNRSTRNMTKENYNTSSLNSSINSINNNKIRPRRPRESRTAFFGSMLRETSKALKVSLPSATTNQTTTRRTTSAASRAKAKAKTAAGVGAIIRGMSSSGTRQLSNASRAKARARATLSS